MGSMRDAGPLTTRKNEEPMSYFGFTDVTSFLVHGIPGAALLFGLFMFSERTKPWIEKLTEENTREKQNSRSLFGQNKYLKDVNASLLYSKHQVDIQLRKKQSTEDRLRGELDRHKRLLRSTELELDQERSKSRGRR